MQVPKLFLRITKTLGKGILGLLILLLIVLAIIHLPPVQKQITKKVSGYLASKIESRVDIQRIRFSLLGSVAIENLAVWDPGDKEILSAREIVVNASVFDLLAGNLMFDEVHLKGVNGQLTQSGEGLNIQFIIDAFKPVEKKETTAATNTINLQFKKVYLEEILFEFNSTVSGTSVAVNLGAFTVSGGKFSTHPTSIKAGQVILQRTIVNVFSTHQSKVHQDTITVNDSRLIIPDFGTRINFEVGDLQFKDNEVSFHRDKVMETQKFNPAHIALKNIQIRLTDILIHEDTLAASLRLLAVQLPQFVLTNASAAIHMNRDQLFLSGFHLASDSNELQADLIAPLNLKSMRSADHFPFSIDTQGRINPKDLDYFLSDSLMTLFNHWGPTELKLEGNYALGKGMLKTLELTTGNNQLHVRGMADNVLDPDKLSWKEVEINVSVGPEFKRTLVPFFRTISLPPSLALELMSSGNTKKIYADGKIFSAWGNVFVNGQMMQDTDIVRVDGKVTGEQVDLGKWMNIAALGPMDLTTEANGTIGKSQKIEINGVISKIEILDQHVHQIAFKSTARKDSAAVTVWIKDPNYRSEIDSEISFAGPLTFANRIRFDGFMLGNLLHADSTLSISGDTKSRLIIDQNSVEGFLEGKDMFFHKQFFEYSLDSMNLHALLSSSKSEFTYAADYAKIKLESNFDLREAGDVIRNRANHILKTSANQAQPSGSRTANFNIEVEDAKIFKLIGIAVDEFASLRVNGEFNEQKQETILQASTGKFRGYGVSLDTLNSNLSLVRDSIITSLSATNLFYDSIKLGKLDFNVLTNGDTAVTNLLVTGDTITLLNFRTRIVHVDSGRLFYPDKLLVFNHDYFIDPAKPVYLGKNQLLFDHFTISRDSMEINLNGNLNAFDASIRNLDLALLNFLVSTDTMVISKGLLSGKVSYTQGHQLNLRATVDSLMLYNSSPMTIAATAVSEKDDVPFEFRLTNPSNAIDLKGTYFSQNKEVDASLKLDVNNPELVMFLISGVVDEMRGSIQGEAAIRGPVQRPAIKGFIGFRDLGLTLANPRLTFNVENDRIALDNSSLLFNRFTLYDQEHNPLTIDGNITYQDYKFLTYNLQINSDQFTLFNNPDSTQGQVRGKLVIDSDIAMKGNAKDKTIDARLTVKDATRLTIVTDNDDINLLRAEGIVEFVNPALLLDSTALIGTVDFYDSLIATLPDFTVQATVVIEDNAMLRVVIDEQSGDNLEISGGAKLELGYDRTGNLKLDGDYTITKGVYRLSFYDLVKKNFQLVPGSSVTWSGNPKNGDLKIKAIHSVASNSIGLIGHEIGENEKSIYKRSLDYQVGININGAIESPVISFSLDLPQNEKTNYPVLASKLDRLRQPEYESELNKQVFGLLVLGGFIPETSGSDINSSAIATTALANSVNSLLASQLNRFTSQYIKGVNIDVGIQSYSDYSAPGGKTQTAMDFRVSKSMMNDRLSFQIGGDFNISQDQSGANTGSKNYRGDIAIIYDLTGNNDKQLKLFNNETYDIVYQEIRNTGISLIFIRDFDSKQKKKRRDK